MIGHGRRVIYQQHLLWRVVAAMRAGEAANSGSQGASAACQGPSEGRVGRCRGSRSHPRLLALQMTGRQRCGDSQPPERQHFGAGGVYMVTISYGFVNCRKLGLRRVATRHTGPRVDGEATAMAHPSGGPADGAAHTFSRLHPELTGLPTGFASADCGTWGRVLVCSGRISGNTRRQKHGHGKWCVGFRPGSCR